MNFGEEDQSLAYYFHDSGISGSPLPLSEAEQPSMFSSTFPEWYTELNSTTEFSRHGDSFPEDFFPPPATDTDGSSQLMLPPIPKDSPEATNEFGERTAITCHDPFKKSLLSGQGRYRTSVKAYTCPWCQIGSSRPGDIIRHFKSYCGSPFVFVCKHCRIGAQSKRYAEKVLKTFKQQYPCRHELQEWTLNYSRQAFACPGCGRVSRRLQDHSQHFVDCCRNLGLTGSEQRSRQIRGLLCSGHLRQRVKSIWYELGLFNRVDSVQDLLWNFEPSYAAGVVERLEYGETSCSDHILNFGISPIAIKSFLESLISKGLPGGTASISSLASLILTNGSGRVEISEIENDCAGCGDELFVSEYKDNKRQPQYKLRPEETTKTIKVEDPIEHEVKECPQSIVVTDSQIEVAKSRSLPKPPSKSIYEGEEWYPDSSQDSPSFHSKRKSRSPEPWDLRAVTNEAPSRLCQLLMEYDACENEDTESLDSDEYSPDCDPSDYQPEWRTELTSVRTGFRGHTAAHGENHDPNGDAIYSTSTGNSNNGKGIQSSFYAALPASGKRLIREDEASDDDDECPRKSRKLSDEPSVEIKQRAEMIPCIYVECPGRNPDISTLVRKLACAHGKCICIKCWATFSREQYDRHVSSRGCQVRCVCKQGQEESVENGLRSPHEQRRSCTRDRTMLKKCQQAYICQVFDGTAAEFKWDFSKPHAGEKQRLGRKSQLRDRIILESQQVEDENEALRLEIRKKNHQLKEKDRQIKEKNYHNKELQDIVGALKECNETFIPIPRFLLRRIEEHAPIVTKSSNSPSSTQEKMLRTPESYNTSQNTPNQALYGENLESHYRSFNQIQVATPAANTGANSNVKQKDYSSTNHAYMNSADSAAEIPLSGAAHPQQYALLDRVETHAPDALPAAVMDLNRQQRMFPVPSDPGVKRGIAMPHPLTTHAGLNLANANFPDPGDGMRVRPRNDRRDSPGERTGFTPRVSTSAEDPRARQPRLVDFGDDDFEDLNMDSGADEFHVLHFDEDGWTEDRPL